MNALLELQAHGQAVWLDFIKRTLMRNGELKKLIDEDGLKGVTSNPSIFEKAIGQSSDYDDTLRELSRDPNAKAISIYERLAIQDIQEAADILRSVYEKTKKVDGYVSLEVSPLLAKDTAGTIEEGLRLWKEVNRPNVMIKVPATDEGIPAIRRLISEGININVTLLFSSHYYEKVARAYMAGLEDRLASGESIDHVFSVASFFISRIDSLVDTVLVQKAKEGESSRQGRVKALMGKAAIANAKLTYQLSYELHAAPNWQTLKAKGGNKQRLLWASTSTKNPAYRDVMYVEELIGQDTVNTLPPATLEAFRDHGIAASTIESNLDAANDTMQSLAEEGVDFEKLCHQLTEEGVKLFADAFEKLLAAVEEKRQLLGGTHAIPGKQ